MQIENKIIVDHWYQKHLTGLTILLLPLSWLFRLVVMVRYFFYRFIFKKKSFPVPIIVVGNLTVGGTGKTPLVIWLANSLKKKGFRPGIVSRGVGGKKIDRLQWVDANSDVQVVGDEAILLARRAACPMVVCADRVAAVSELLRHSHCNVVISDDGLQHYRLSRDIEIIVIDGARGLGNDQLLPAGPLREPRGRLQRADLIVVNGDERPLSHAEKNINPDKIISMSLAGNTVSSIAAPNKSLDLSCFANKTVHALAAIGHPHRFFETLRKQNVDVIEHVFPDHYLYQREDIFFADNLPVIMTEKDAVKCVKWADERHWYLPVDAHFNAELEMKIFSMLEAICGH